MAKQTKIIYEHCFKIVLQQLAETEFSEINIDEFDFESFSNSKKMFDYQIESLKSALRVLHKFYVDYQGSKVEFYNNEYKKYPHEN